MSAKPRQGTQEDPIVSVTHDEATDKFYKEKFHSGELKTESLIPPTTPRKITIDAGDRDIPYADYENLTGDYLGNADFQAVDKNKPGHVAVPSGVAVTVRPPSIQANPEDPRQVTTEKNGQMHLFSYRRPEIEELYASDDAAHLVPAALNEARKVALKTYGAAPMHAAILSPYSHTLVKHAVERGLVAPHPYKDVTKIDYSPSTSDESILRAQRETAIRHSSAQIEWARAFSDHKHLEHEDATNSGEQIETLPEGTVSQSNREVRQLLRRNNTIQPNHPQFTGKAPATGTQLELF